MKPGKLIVFEGIDGTGKTTQVTRANSYLIDRLGAENVRRSKDLGGSLLGEELRQIMYESCPPSQMAPGVVDLLFLAGHLQNWDWISKELAFGHTVVSDRWWLSQFTYTAVRTSDQGVQALYWKKKGGLPDLTIFLYGDPVELLRRANARVDSATHQSQKPWNDPMKQAIVCQRYIDLFSSMDGWYPICVDGLDEEQVWAKVKLGLDVLTFGGKDA